MDPENSVKLMPKRISKVESYLRKNLPQVDSACARYYEVCVVETKGALLLRYVVLTDESLLLTENPPKNFIQTIRLSQIQDISLVADRGTLIKGGNNNSYICQHVRVIYQENAKESLGANSNRITSSRRSSRGKLNSSSSNKSKDQVTGSNSSRSSTVSSADEISSMTEISVALSEDKIRLARDHESASASDDSAGGHEYPFVSLAIRTAYEPLSYPPPPSSTSTSGLLDASFPPSGSDDSGLLLSSLSVSSGSIISENGKASSVRGDEDDDDDDDDTDGRYRGDRVRRKNKRNNKHRGHRNRRELDVEEEEDEMFSLNSSSGIGSVGKENKLRHHHHHQYHHHHNLHGSPTSRANSVLEQRPFSWTSEEDENNAEGKKRRPRSVDNISQLSSLRKRLLGKYFNSNSSNSKNNSSETRTISSSPRPHKNTGGSNSRNSSNGDGGDEDEDEDASKKEDVKTKLKELNFYLYQPNSSLLNELFLFWNRHILKCTLQMEEAVFGALGQEEESYSLRAAEKILARLTTHDGVMLTETKLFRKFSQLLPTLSALHKNLLRYQHMKRLCWQNWNLVTGLLDILKRCCSRTTTGEGEVAFLEKVSTYAIVMDIFRLLFQACSTSFFVQPNNFSNNNYNSRGSKITTPSPATTTTLTSSSTTAATDTTSYPATTNSPNNNNDFNGVTSRNMNLPQITSALLQSIYSYPVIPSGFSSSHSNSADTPVRDTILRVIFDPQRFAKAEWTNSQEAKMIKLITIGHNASVAVLYEILTVVYFSPRDNERTTFMTYLQKYSMDSYVKQSVTQIINLLWSNRRSMRPSQCVLLYRHVSVLKTLLDNLPSVKTFVRLSFCEEFQYFVHGRSANMKIPDRYPIKPKLLLTCDELRKEIIQKSDTN